MKRIKDIILCTTLIIVMNSAGVGASMLDYLSPVDPTEVQPVKNNTEFLYQATPAQKAKLTQNDVRNHYEIAMQRFMQCNVKSAYMDFKMLIRNIIPNDYAYLKIADDLAGIGLFNLSEEALNKASDREIAFTQAEDIKKFYFPKNQLTDADEVYLAEIYSNIMYNAQSKEAANELLKNTSLLGKSDYANYLVALGLLKAGDLDSAETYINKALKINPDNINFQKLKIEIILQGNNVQNALKVLANMKNAKLYTDSYINKVNSLEQYTLYKTEKNETLKKYHLGYYYFYLGEYTKAVRTLQSAISSKKKYNRIVYALMSEIYFEQKEYEKAENFADKSLKLGGNDPKALMILGKINYRNQNYKEALKYFKSAESREDALPSVWTAMTYMQLGDTSKAKDINYKILKEHSDCYLVYYNVALQDKEREYEYMKKSVAINLDFIDGWLGLAKCSLDKNNLDNAAKYLGIVKCIDENDFRYYYYQGLVYKAKGLNQDANFFFKKSIALNPDNELAKKELGI